MNLGRVLFTTVIPAGLYADSWKWWFRFKKPVLTIVTNGCWDDTCVGLYADGCKCNNFDCYGYNKLPKGYELIASCRYGRIFYNGTNLARSIHDWGR